MKRILSAIICLIIVIGILPTTAHAYEYQIKTLNILIKDPVASYTPGAIVDMESNISDPMISIHNQIVTWKDTFFNKTLTNKDEFVAGLPYKVTITLYCMVDVEFARDIYGNLATNITLNGRPVTVEKVGYVNGRIESVTFSYQYEPLSGMVISSVLVKGVPEPKAGEMPIFSFTLGSSVAYTFYHTEPITWYDENEKRFLSSDDTFVKGHRYRVQIWVAANRSKGYTFKLDSRGEPDVDVTINSFAPHSVNTAYEQDPREVIAISYLFPACKEAHTCAPKLVAQQDPTCVMPGFKAYYECSCGKCYEDAAGKKQITDMDGYGILPALGHQAGGWSYNGTHHYRKCTRCLEVIPGTTAAHSGGKATCVEKGKCTVCGYAYLPENEDHTPDTKWTACASLYHAKLCTLCGAHCDPEDHVPGPAATETKPQTCKVCGYIIKPAKGHKHQLTRVAPKPATCMEEGNIEYYSCTGCNDCFTDAAAKNKISDKTSVKIGALGHTASEDWSNNEQYHWRTCTVCKAELDETKMLHEEENGKCNTCGHTTVPGETTPDPTTPAPTTPDPTTSEPPTSETKPGAPTETTPTQSQEKETSNGSWLIILLLALVCSAAASLVTLFIIKRKK